MSGISWGIVAVTLLLSYGSGFRGVLMYTFEVFGKARWLPGRERPANRLAGSAQGNRCGLKQKTRSG